MTTLSKRATENNTQTELDALIDAAVQADRAARIEAERQRQLAALKAIEERSNANRKAIEQDLPENLRDLLGILTTDKGVSFVVDGEAWHAEYKGTWGGARETHWMVFSPNQQFKLQFPSPNLAKGILLMIAEHRAKKASAARFQAEAEGGVA